ncbi:hypothetical protein SAMN02910447_03190 [Ruminococcus sp. YE71]|nr:hypothetical protein SAMN02910446_03261 [Ruminococcus sp. YE78]SFW49580.1 hypothetical protein SAMN02910447_03190 [Ruminococcus sp. YE71]
MDVVLQEKGITVTEPEQPECTIVDDIPEKYTAYESLTFIVSARHLCAFISFSSCSRYL